MTKQKQIFGWCLVFSLFSLLTIHAQDEVTKAPQDARAASNGVTVDIYQYMDGGTPGTQVTADIMKASSIGGISGLPVPDWELTASDPTNPYNGVWISADHVRQLPGKVTVDGVDYSGLGTHTWSVFYKKMTNYVTIMFGDERQWNHTPYHSSMTVACFYTPGTWFLQSGMNLDTIGLSGTTTMNGSSPQYNYAVFAVQNGTNAANVRVNAHTEKGSSPPIILTSGHTYWVNLHYNGPEGKGKIAVFDPDNGWAQVGQISELEFQASANPMDTKVRSRVKIGRYDTHANYTSDSNPQEYFSHIMIDYSEAKFPLLPGGINEQSQTITLAPGWNWISFNVLPADLSHNSIFSSILAQVEQVKVQTQSAMRSGGNCKGDLTDMNGIRQYKMYKVKVNAACTLNVTGTAVLSATPIQLAGGWNWVAYLPTTAMPIATALDSIKVQVLEVKSLTQSATYSGSVWSGTLTQLEPGQGYAVKMSGPGTLIYPAAAATQLNQQKKIQ
jgi:hypothetical protein